MNDQQDYDIAIIGAGPGGYVAAIRAAQLGLKVCCIEKEKALGGTCLRVGCIPSKALLESSEMYEEANDAFANRGILIKKMELDLGKMMSHKDRVVQTLTGGISSLFKKNNITRIFGSATFTSPNELKISLEDGSDQTVKAKNIIIATGSTAATLPGIKIDGKNVCSSTEALSFEKVPKTLGVIGGGYIGLEMGTIWRRLGSEVTIVEYLPRIMPGMDAEIATEALKIFKKQGLKFELGSKVKGVNASSRGAEILIEGKESIKCEKVLVAVGRKAKHDKSGTGNYWRKYERTRFYKRRFPFSHEPAICFRDWRCHRWGDAGTQSGRRGHRLCRWYCKRAWSH